MRLTVFRRRKQFLEGKPTTESIHGQPSTASNGVNLNTVTTILQDRSFIAIDIAEIMNITSCEPAEYRTC